MCLRLHLGFIPQLEAHFVSYLPHYVTARINIVFCFLVHLSMFSSHNNRTPCGQLIVCFFTLKHTSRRAGRLLFHLTVHVHVFD